MSPENASERLSEGGFFERYGLWNRIDATINVDGREPDELGKASRIKIGASEGVTYRVIPGEAVPAGIAGNVMGGHDPVPFPVAIDPFSHFDHFSSNLMPENQGRPFDPIPCHDVTATDPTCLYPNE